METSSPIIEVGRELTPGQKKFLELASKKGVPLELFSDYVPDIRYETPIKPHLPTILYIHTGGTLMMVSSQSESGALSFRGAIDIEKVMKVADQVCNITDRYNLIGLHVCNIDSKEIRPREWRAMAGAIRTFYEEINGVVIGHGTNTAEFTAAALSFSLRRLAIPIVITASQLPIIGFPGSDGLQNLTGSMQIAAYGNLSEVIVYANGDLHQGTRVVKADDKRLRIFESLVIDPIGHFAASGNNVEVKAGVTHRNASEKYELLFQPYFSTSVTTLTLNPGMDPDTMERILKNAEGERKDVGLILATYGSGAIPDEFVPILAGHHKAGYPIFLTSMCADSGASLDMQSHDEAAIAAYRAGVRLAGDMTTTAASVKLMVVQASADRILGHAASAPDRLAFIEREMSRVYAGEMSVAPERGDY